MQSYVENAQAQGVRLTAAAVAVRPAPTASGIQVLPELSSSGRVVMTREVIPLARQSWTLTSDGRQAVAPLPVSNPALWWVRSTAW